MPAPTPPSPCEASPPTAEVAPNYRYWRDHGAEWVREYDRRKRWQPQYHIQEWMLLDYFEHHAPARVLEFGCGWGRHLRNLRDIEGLEVFGFDQSAAMVGGMRQWASPEWIDRHVVVGQPTGPLPYDDGAFDIVYTAEVLVHVRPEHLGGVLAELARVCRGHLLHLETSQRHRIQSDEHHGCWKHDLVSAYRSLGLECRVLEAGYFTHDPYRVDLCAAGEDGPGRPRYEWSPRALRLWRRMEQQLSSGITNLRRENALLNRTVARVRSLVNETVAESTDASGKTLNGADGPPTT